MEATLLCEAQDCIDALRLAMEGSTDDGTRIRIFTWLLDRAPDSDPESTHGTILFVRAITDLQGEVRVTDPT